LFRIITACGHSWVTLNVLTVGYPETTVITAGSSSNLS